MTEPPPLTLHDRFRGLLLGGAVGDALGAPVEFMRRDDILFEFGVKGIGRFAPAYGRLGAVTDDTQMTLFTLEGLIRADVRHRLKGICHPAAVIDHAYRRWLATQGEAPEDAPLDGWLIGTKALWSRRAPGLTCLGALRSKDPGRFGEPAVNDSKGAGGIMRVAPIGLVARDPYALACEAAGLTHGHVTGRVAAGWFAEWIARTAAGDSFRPGAQAAWRRCRGEAPQLDAALALAFDLAEAGPAGGVPTMLGEGWIAEDAAAIALWCVLAQAEPFEALRLAVNIDGDSDTTGTLVGQILGAALGPGWIPPELLEGLELREEIERLAADAAAVFAPDSTADLGSEDWWTRYPGW